MAKQRPLTDIQLTVINMKLAKRSNNEIALELGIHPATVSCKWRDIQRGLAKGAYNNVPLKSGLNANLDLFEVTENGR